MIRALDDKTLLAGMRLIAGNVRAEQVRGLEHLAEIEARKAYVPEGFASLWAYCRDELKFSESVTSRWTRALKATRRFPMILESLGAGRISLCAVAMLADHLTDENWAAVVARAEGRTKIEVLEIIAALAPQPAKKDVITARHFSGRSELSSSAAPALALDLTPARPAPRPVVTPKAPEVWRIAFDASVATKKKLERLRELRAGKALDDVLGEALDSFLEKIDPERRHVRRERRRERQTAPCPQKAAAAPVPPMSTSNAPMSASTSSAVAPVAPVTPMSASNTPAVSPAAPKSASDSPAAVPATPRRKAVPAATRDAVSARDGSRCTFVAGSGRRCASRSFIDLDHIHPVAFGGGNAPENLRALCQAHHRLETRDQFCLQTS